MTDIFDKTGYPDNSIKGKMDSSKKLEKVANATIVKKKKTFLGFVFGENTKIVMNYILFDVLIPAAKNTISEMVSSGIEMLLYGEPRRRRDNRRSIVSYSSYYKDRDRERPYERNRARHEFDDIVIDTRPEAEEALGQLVDIIDNYGVVTIADFYDLVGLNGDWADHKYGWDNLSRATVQRVKEGYILDLPKPTVLD